MNISGEVQRLQERFPRAWSFGEETVTNLVRLGRWIEAQLTKWSEPKRALGVVLPVVATLLGVAPWMVFGYRLPDQVAIFWDLDGDIAVQVPRLAAGTLFIGLTITLALSIAATVGEYSTRPVSDSSQGALILGVLVFAQTSLVWISGFEVVFPQFDATSPDDGLSHSAGWWVAPVFLGVLWGQGIAGSLRRVAVGRGHQAWVPWSAWQLPPTSGLAFAPSERVAWVGVCHSRLLRRVGGVLLAITAVLMISIFLGGGLFGLIVRVLWAVVFLHRGVSFIAVASTRVTVGAHGVRVHSVILPWPSITFPLNRIVRATAIDVDAFRGWGRNGSLRLLREAFWVVRQGEGIQLTLVDGRVFRVTVDGAATAADVINGLVARRWGQPVVS